MTTAKVTLPDGLDPTAGLRLRRLSGRPVAMYLDSLKTIGPMYYLTQNMLGSGSIWVDANLYELVVSNPGGLVTVTQIQVGEGSTPATDIGDLVTYTDLTALLAEERAESDGLYLRADADETISGQWDFTAAPTVNGEPIGTGGGGDVDLSDYLTIDAFDTAMGILAAQLNGVLIGRIQSLVGGYAAKQGPPGAFYVNIGTDIPTDLADGDQVLDYDAAGV